MALAVSPQDCVVCSAQEFVPGIQRLLANATLREQMGIQARRLAVEQFDWATVARKAACAMLALLEGNSPNAT